MNGPPARFEAKGGVFGSKRAQNSQKTGRIRAFLRTACTGKSSVMYSFRVSYVQMRGCNRSCTQGVGGGVLGVRTGLIPDILKRAHPFTLPVCAPGGEFSASGGEREALPPMSEVHAVQPSPERGDWASCVVVWSVSKTQGAPPALMPLGNLSSRSLCGLTRRPAHRKGRDERGTVPGNGMIGPPAQGVCSPRCPTARHLGHPASMVVLTYPGTWATRHPRLRSQTVWGRGHSPLLNPLR
jgi:hypothetical protein